MPVAPALRPHLDRHILKLARGNWMFPQFRASENSQPCEPKGRMDRLFVRLVAETDFDGLTYYCLRHSFISVALAKGTPADQVAQWVGHTSTQLTVTTYSHFLPDKSVQRMEALRLFEGSVS